LQKSLPVERSAITLASLVPAPLRAAVSARSMSVVSTLPSAGRSMVMVVTAPSRDDLMSSDMMCSPWNGSWPIRIHRRHHPRKRVIQ
jgi:hypothetical protein